MKRVDSSPDLPRLPGAQQTQESEETGKVREISQSRLGWIGTAFWRLLNYERSEEREVKVYTAPCVKPPETLKTELIGLHSKDAHRKQVIENFFALIGPMADRSQRIQDDVIVKLKEILKHDQLIEPLHNYLEAALKGHQTRLNDLNQGNARIEFPDMKHIGRGFTQLIVSLAQVYQNNSADYVELFTSLMEFAGMPNFQLYSDYAARVHYDEGHEKYPQVRGSDLLRMNAVLTEDAAAREIKSWSPEDKLLAARGYWTRQNAFVWNFGLWQRLDARADHEQDGRHIVRHANYCLGNAVPGLFARETDIELDFRPWLAEDCSFEQSEELFSAVTLLLKMQRIEEYEAFVNDYYEGKRFTWIDPVDFGALLDYFEELVGDFDKTGRIDQAQLYVLMGMPHEENDFEQVRDISQSVFHPNLLEALYCLEELTKPVKDPLLLARFVELADTVGLDEIDPEHLAHVHAQLTRVETFLGHDLDIDFRVLFYKKLMDSDLQTAFRNFDDAVHTAERCVQKIDHLGVDVMKLDEVQAVIKTHSTLIEYIGQQLKQNASTEQLQGLISSQLKVALESWVETDERLLRVLFERASAVFQDAWGPKLEAFYRRLFAERPEAYAELERHLDSLTEGFTHL